MAAQDPFEHYRRLQEQIQRALEGPLRNVIRQQEAVRRAMNGPARRIERWQKQIDAAAGAPALKAFEQQRAFQESLERPLRILEQQNAQLRRALEGPLVDLQRYQEQIAKATAGTYAAIARNQELLLAAMEAAGEEAAAEPEDQFLENADPEIEGWLQAWAAQVELWAPTSEQVQSFLEALSFLLALLLYAADRAEIDVPQEALLGAIGILSTAGAVVIRWHRKRNPPE